MKKPLTKSGVHGHVIGIIVCLIVVAYLLPSVIKDWGKPPKTEQRIVKVQKRYHYPIAHIRQIPTGDPNVFVGVAEYDPNTPPEVTILKDGEEVGQESNWEALNKAQEDYFKK